MKVLVTGATGTFGRACVRELLAPDSQATAVVAFARSESRLAALKTVYADRAEFKPFLGDVRDLQRLTNALVGVDVVIHAAALKRVDDGAYNPSEMVATNIVGTQNICQAATACGVSRVVMVSSDKAVEPWNIYGATKMVAEQQSIAFNSIAAPQGTRIAIVRYGNVIASTGSVLTIWTQARDADRPLPVTDLSMTRFVLTIQDGVRFAIRAAMTLHGGEVFVPHLQSVKLSDFAEAFAPGYPTVTIGRRVGGEKPHEVLLSPDEHPRTVASALGYVVTPPTTPWSWTTEQPYADAVAPGWLTDEGWETIRYSSDNPRFLTHTAETMFPVIARGLEEVV